MKLLIVDDEKITREGLLSSLDLKAIGITQVLQADDGVHGLKLALLNKPEIVLTDVRMPRMDGVEATRRIRENDGPRVLVLTTFDLDEYAYDAIQAGASGFLLKDAPLEELVAAIRHVHDGDAVVAPSTTRRLLDRFAEQRPDPPHARAWDGAGVSELTAREREVLELIAQGLSNGEIAERLVIAESTARVHVGRILAKLGLRDRVQAVVMAYQSGLVRTDT